MTFPGRRVDLDHNATTPPSRRVRRRMARVLARVPGNPSSRHRSGREAATLIEDARAVVAATVNADPEEIVSREAPPRPTTTSCACSPTTARRTGPAS